MKIGIFLGSIRKGRVGEAVARWVSDAAEKRDGFEYERLDLSEFNVPLLDAEMVPGAANKQYEDEATTAWSKACLLYTSPSPRDATLSRMPSSA